MITSTQVCEMAGISYRRLDFYVRQGYLRPQAQRANRCGGGQGYPRQWTPDEAAVARRMAELVRSGMVPAAAAELARNATGTGWPGPAPVPALAARKQDPPGS